MKKFMFCFIAFFAVQSTWCSASEEILRDTYSQMLDTIVEREMLLKNLELLCPGHTVEFSNALSKSEQGCLTSDQFNETMCSVFKSQLSRCYEPISNVLTDCLPEQSLQIPQFVTDSMVAVADYMCKSDGEHLFEIFNPCARNATHRFQRCQRILTSKLQQQINKPNSKSDVCEALRSLKACLESHLNTACGSPITREVFMGIYNTVLKQCDSASPANNQIKTEKNYESHY